MIEPKDCETLAEVRTEIDRLDQSLINTISRRQKYVHAAARFKRSEKDVHAPERQRQMMAARRLWAETEGVDPDLIESLFRTMVDHFVSAELTILSERENQKADGKSST
jgi:isochorismate pyruvate lyase